MWFNSFWTSEMFRLRVKSLILLFWSLLHSTVLSSLSTPLLKKNSLCGLLKKNSLCGFTVFEHLRCSDSEWRVLYCYFEVYFTQRFYPLWARLYLKRIVCVVYLKRIVCVVLQFLNIWDVQTQSEESYIAILKFTSLNGFILFEHAFPGGAGREGRRMLEWGWGRCWGQGEYLGR